MSEKDIIEKAKESLESVFEDPKEKVGATPSMDLDANKIKETIEKEVATEEANLEKLDALKHKIAQEAQKEVDLIKEPEVKAQAIENPTVEEEAEELKAETERQFKLAQEKINEK